MACSGCKASIRGIWRRAARRLMLSLMCVLAPALSAQATAPELILEDHPLVNTLWDVDAGRAIDEAELRARLRQADYLLLGEKHDNIAHHRHQAWAVDQLERAANKVGVAFEMIDTAQSETLGRHWISDLGFLLDTLEASASGWRYRTLYAPLFAAVVNAGYAIYAANLPRSQIRAMSMRGQAPPAYVTRILEAAPFDARQSASLKQEIRDSHCDLLGAAMIGPMAEIQRIRDAVMTHSLVDNGARHAQMVLVAGNGHVRADRGVPHYLREQAPRERILSVAFIEVREGAAHVDAYTDRWASERLPFDIVWFTPRAQREDPCKRMREQLRSSGPG